MVLKYIIMGKELQIRELALPLGSLEAYIYWTSQIPMLSAAEEQELARRFREQQDLAAARKLVMAHLRFVVSIARNYLGYGLPHADLIQEGNIGLMKAVKRFDPSMGVRLVSFAVHWIKAEMHEFILRNWRMVKIATTKAQRKLFFNLRKFSKRLGWFSNEEIQYVANELKVSPREVLTMEARLNSIDEALEGSMDDSEENSFAPINYLEDPEADPAIALENSNYSEACEQKLAAALLTLDERSQDILQHRWLTENKATLHDLAAKYNVSAERIRQIETQAMKKLKQAIAL